MLTHIMGFVVYTLAMVGIIFISFIVYKKTAQSSLKCTRGIMKVEEMLSIAPRKALLVVRVKNERFLIASDAEETRLISRLEGSELQFEQEEFENKVEGLNTLYKKRDLFREEPIKDKIPRETFVEREVVTYDKKPPMMRELLRKLGK